MITFNYTNTLTPEEEKARDIMIYLFNPVLKFIFLNTNASSFIQYGFNSCRQTAILGAFYLKFLLPDYEFNVFEGTFIEKINSKIEKYEHAYIIASKGNRNLIIDLSRTTKRLLFHPVFSEIYPKTLDYREMCQISKKWINLDEMIYTDQGEFYTNLVPSELMVLISTMINELSCKPKEEILKFSDSIYSITTRLRRCEALD